MVLVLVILYWLIFHSENLDVWEVSEMDEDTLLEGSANVQESRIESNNDHEINQEKMDCNKDTGIVVTDDDSSSLSECEDLHEDKECIFSLCL